jgi:hypothetical protein
VSVQVLHLLARVRPRIQNNPVTPAGDSLGYRYLMRLRHHLGQ